MMAPMIRSFLEIFAVAAGVDWAVTSCVVAAATNSMDRKSVTLRRMKLK